VHRIRLLSGVHCERVDALRVHERAEPRPKTKPREFRKTAGPGWV